MILNRFAKNSNFNKYYFMKLPNTFYGLHENIEAPTETSITLKTVAEAETIYQSAIERFLNLNQWHELTGTSYPRFTVTNAFGIEVQRKIITGDYICIKTKNAQWPKWLYIDEVFEFSNEVSQITSVYLHPSQNPFEHATNSLTISRSVNIVSAAIAPASELLALLQWDLLTKSFLQNNF